MIQWSKSESKTKMLQFAATNSETCDCRLDPEDPESERVFSDMHTGLWMQKIQIVVGEERTPIGVIIYSDKTHALQGMGCYPLYMTLVNLDNNVRFSNAGWQLVALLPIPVKSQGNYSGKKKLSVRKVELFHGKNLQS